MHKPSPNSNRWQLQRSISSCSVQGTELINEVLCALRRRGWDEEDVFAVQMALEEAICNAIKHGNASDRDKRVTMDCCLSDDRLKICVSDEGSGFDPGGVPDPTAEENLDNPSGRGLLLMKSFMNTVEFNDKGNSVSMEKSRSKP